MLRPRLNFLWSAGRRFLQTRSVQSLLDDPAGVDQVRVVGWIKSIKNQKEIKFLHLNDGSDCRHLQLVAVLEDFADRERVERVFGDLSFNAAIEATGKLVKSEHKMQSVELRISDIKLVGSCPPDAEYPFQAKGKCTLEQLRPVVHMRSHDRLFAAIMRFRSQLTMDFHQYFHRNRFVQVHTPLVTTNNCEGGCEAFQVATADEIKSKKPFFSTPAYLTASAQLHLEAATTTLARVYTLSPTFRAEKSMTKHHLAEFYMLEAEAIDMNSLDALMDLVEDMVKQVGRSVLANFSKHDLDLISSQTPKGKKAQGPSHSDLLLLNDKKFVRISYEEAIELLNSKTGAKKLSFGDDLTKEHEKALVASFEHAPVFVTKYPRELKPFYMRQSETSERVVDNFDLLVPGVGELVGGSLRENRLDLLVAAMTRQGLSPDSFKDYLGTKKYGGMRMGGFGLGLERFIQFILNIDNIRDTCLFPRALGSCKM